MKKLMVFLCAMFLVFGFAGVAGAVQTWATGVTAATGWLDADKDWSDDTLLCWAASASNLLSWGDWDGGPGLVTEDQIFDDFETYWNDDQGNPYYAVDWWFTGQNDHQGDANWAQLTPPPTHNGFYTEALFNANYDSDWYNSLDDIAAYLAAGRAVGVRVADVWGHFLTVWGVDPATGDLWVTDSDMNIDTLDHYTVSGTDLDGVYTDWEITAVYGLLPNSGGIDPTLREEAPVPEPATMLLLGAGLLGLALSGRRIRRA